MAVTINRRGLKITIDLPTLERLNPDNVMNNETKDRLGNTALTAIKSRVTNGLSPVEGVPRFPGYKSTRDGSGYPRTAAIREKFPAKKTRPVNLTLSGEFLSLLTYRVDQLGITIGWFDRRQRTRDLIATHQEGRHPHVPRRQILPLDEGNRFVASIRRSIKNVVLERITRIINS